MSQFEELTIRSQYAPTVTQVGDVWETHWEKIHHDEIGTTLAECHREHGLFTADDVDEEVEEKTSELSTTIADLRRELRKLKETKKETSK